MQGPVLQACWGATAPGLPLSCCWGRPGQLRPHPGQALEAPLGSLEAELVSSFSLSTCLLNRLDAHVSTELSHRHQHYHLRAILMGVVRQEVKRSAGRSGFMGSSSLASQAASWMQFFMEGGRGIWASGWLGLMAATWAHKTGQQPVTQAKPGEAEERSGRSTAARSELQHPHHPALRFPESISPNRSQKPS